jgi:DDE superfamily endonuclease
VKKPRKSKKNPHPQLSAAQKAANTALSQVRIFVEHAIGGMKRSNILVHGFRNHKANFDDDVIGVCAGLWNFVLSY